MHSTRASVSLKGTSKDSLSFFIECGVEVRMRHEDPIRLVPAAPTVFQAHLRGRCARAARYRYKTHVSVDRKTKLMIEERATAANLHDSPIFDELLGKPKKRGRDVWVDSAYSSGEQEQDLTRRGFCSHVHEHAYRCRPLTAKRQRVNRTKSRARARVEHSFAAMTQMGGMTVRSIGIERARAWSTMKALRYDFKRLDVPIRMGKIPIDGTGLPA